MSKLFLWLLLLPLSVVYAQQTLQGTVIDGDTKEPLQGATVFVANSTFSTVTNSEGKFYLSVPNNAYEIVISYVGFAPALVTSKSFIDLTVNYKIEIFTQAEQIKPVIILSDKVRQQYMKLFRSGLIGTSKNAQKAHLINYEDLEFSFDETRKILSATSTNPLIIENPELNYRITFILSYFEIDTQSGVSNYSGYPLFEELKPADATSKKTIKNRLRAYRGSVMHFMQSLYRNTLSSEGFGVSAFKVLPNPAYPGDDEVKAIFATAKRTGNMSPILHLPQKNLYITTKTGLTAQELLVKKNGRTYLQFEDFLEVVYKNEKVEPIYSNRFVGHSTDNQCSQLNKTSDLIEILQNGNYHDASKLTLHGYMGWEKLANMVPWDYPPPQNEQ